MSWVKVFANDELAQGERKVVKTENGKVLMVNFQGDMYAVTSPRMCSPKCCRSSPSPKPPSEP
ncbi:MAG: hypothetical protein AAGE92_17955, partial [Cyanobacteria bacterium P01_G01_bin.4]